MKQIGKLTMMLFALLLWTGCSEETIQGDDDKTPQPDENTLPPREVMFTLNNELKLMKSTTKAGGDTPVATAEENAIASLDIFVFGCATEEGDYTFQEMFSYRADDTADLPLGATVLELTPTDETNKQTKGLLKLKKGLFVKLYCIANSTSLTDPAGDPVDYTDFVPLVFTQPGEAGTTVATEGLPTETQFTSYHTPLLKAGKADDILLTPLAMSGAYTIPLDLTDFSTSTQLQIGFKLTRVAARFDIINKADESRFTIREVSMGNGRRGSTFFPIRIYGDTPTAQDGELITYPARPFDGENANTGTQTGAFYSYPSPAEDKGFIILKGTYQTNKTDQQEVSYQIPFTQTDTDGNTTILEINNNHRYTIAITEADDYHLDFTLTVADWTDSGDIDDYNPSEDGKSTVEINIPDAFNGKTYYTEETRTVSMYIKEGDGGEKSTFDIIARSSMPLTLRSSYAGSMGTKEYDWLKVGELLQKVSNTAYYEYTCHLSLQDGYDKKRYPKAVLRFMNLVDGSESVVLVDAQSAPSTNETPQPNGSHNSFDPMTSTATLYKTDNSTVVIKLTCADGVKVKSQPTWLNLTDTQQSGIETTYTFKLNDRTTAETGGTIVFCNSKHENWETPITVELLDASSNPVFKNVGGGTNNVQTGDFTTNDANINMSLINQNTFTVKTSSLDGVKVEISYENGTSAPKWLICTGTSSLKSAVINEHVFKLNSTELTKGIATKATVTLKNISGGGDETFTITPEYQAPSLSTATSMNMQVNNASNDLPTITISGKCIGGSTIEGPDWLTYTPANSSTEDFSYTVSINPNAVSLPTSSPGNQTITVKNKANETKTTAVTVNITETKAREGSVISSSYTENLGSSSYRISTSGGTLKITVYGMFVAPTTTYSYDGTYCNSTNSGNSWLQNATTEKKIVNNRREYTLSIPVKAASGTDAAYQLHKGGITLNHNGNALKSYTIWRGASTVGYKISNGASSYYSAVNIGGYWWSPINLGAKRIATKGNDSTDGIGLYYQWGRADGVNSTPTFHYNETTDTPAAGHFYTSGSDWRTTSNNNLWTSSGGTKNPCPSGWHVPTKTEIEAINNVADKKWDATNKYYIVPSNNTIPLILPACGEITMGGVFKSWGEAARYWTSTPSDEKSYHLSVQSYMAIGATQRAFGWSVRCVKNS